MARDWSYYHNRPRAEVHGGSPPPRQGLRGGGRMLLGSAPPRLGARGGRRLEEGDNTLGWLLLGAALLYLLGRR